MLGFASREYQSEKFAPTLEFTVKGGRAVPEPASLALAARGALLLAAGYFLNLLLPIHPSGFIKQADYATIAEQPATISRYNPNATSYVK